MTPIDRTTRAGVTAFLGGMMLYGLWSTPGLIAEWGASAAGVLVTLGWGALVGWAVLQLIRPGRPAAWIAFGFAAIAMRIAAAALITGRDSPGDSHWYPVLAANLLAGHGLVLDEPYMGVAVRALYPPAYPILLAGWSALFGASTAAHLVLSTVLDVGSAALLTAIGRKLGATRAGWVAGALFVIWPGLVLGSPLAQKESLSNFLILALACAWLSGRSGWRGALAIGVPAGLLALTQPGQAALAGLFALAVLPALGWRRMLAIGMGGAAVSIAVLAPWWVRNWLVFGAFVPLTSAGGISLWIGNNPDATGGWLPYPKQLRGLPELAYSRAAAAIAEQWIASHPFEFVRLTATKLVRAVGQSEGSVSRIAAFGPPVPAPVFSILLPLVQAAHMVLLGAGAAAARVRDDAAVRQAALLVAAGIAQLSLFGVWFEFAGRHRAFLTPLVLLLVTTAVEAWARSHARNSARPVRAHPSSVPVS